MSSWRTSDSTGSSRGMSDSPPAPSSLELSRGHQGPGLERADRRVVGVDRAAQPLAERGQVLDHRLEAVVELAAERLDVAGVPRHLLLPPAVGDGSQRRDERRRRGEDDILGLTPVSISDGSCSSSPCQTKRLAGQKEHDEFRCGVELLPIRLLAELAEVAADLRGRVP